VPKPLIFSKFITECMYTKLVSSILSQPIVEHKLRHTIILCIYTLIHSKTGGRIIRETLLKLHNQNTTHENTRKHSHRLPSYPSKTRKKQWAMLSIHLMSLSGSQQYTQQHITSTESVFSYHLMQSNVLVLKRVEITSIEWLLVTFIDFAHCKKQHCSHHFQS